MELLLRSAALTCFGAPANRSPYDFCESVAKAIPIWHIKVSGGAAGKGCGCRSEEHTSELQSQFHLVCRLLLEKKKSPSFLSPFPFYITLSRCCPTLIFVRKPAERSYACNPKSANPTF